MGDSIIDKYGIWKSERLQPNVTKALEERLSYNGRLVVPKVQPVKKANPVTVAT